MSEPKLTDPHHHDLANAYLANARDRFSWYKRLAEAAFAQLEPDDFHALLDPEANSVAVIVRHLSGNMRSRFRDFLSSDGEKPDRNRDAEIVDDGAEREALLVRWERGWAFVFEALDGLGPDDLLATVTVRGEPHSVLEAVQRELTHYAAHVGQIVVIAKHLKGEAWQSLSIPKGESQVYNAALGYRDDLGDETP